MDDYIRNCFQDEVLPNDDFDEDQLFFLEDSWEDFVANPDRLTKNNKLQQDVIWEIMKEERAYIKELHTVQSVNMIMFRESNRTITHDFTKITETVETTNQLKTERQLPH